MSDEHGVLIVGAGWIGRQVGLRMAICGLQVDFVDRAPQVLQAAHSWMQSSADQYIDSILSRTGQAGTAQAPKGQTHTAQADTTRADTTRADTTWANTGQPPAFNLDAPVLTPTTASGWESRVTFGRTASELADRIAVVLECVPEQITLKRRILRDFSRQFPKSTIIASNSSYFTPSTLAKFVEAPQRFAHWHFHVPLHRSSVVDIAGHPATEPWVLERLQSLTQQIDQYPLRLRHEHPGYVFNWLLQSVLRSALELAARDVVDIADIDRAWKAVSGMPFGPFQMMDNIGLDVIEQVLANARWEEAQPVAIDKLLAILREPIARGDLGVKTGRGFYEHEHEHE